MHVERLRQLSAYLRTLPDELFDIRQWFKTDDPYADWEGKVPHECGAVACIAGHALKLFAENEPMDVSPGQSAQTILDLSTYHRLELFDPIDHPFEDRALITPKHAAQVIDHLVETGEVNWHILTPNT